MAFLNPLLCLICKNFEIYTPKNFSCKFLDKTRIENKAKFLLKDYQKHKDYINFRVAKTVTKPNEHLGRQIYITAISLDKAAALYSSSFESSSLTAAVFESRTRQRFLLHQNYCSTRKCNYIQNFRQK